jgi:carboxyl-terminal processing protease
VTVSVACLGAAVWFGTHSLVPDSRVLAAPRHFMAAPPAGDPHGPASEDERTRTFRMPSGDAPSLSCEDAKTIVRQVRKNLAYAPDPVAPRAFALTTSDWLDPYGLWSVAPDAPVEAALERAGPALLADIEGRGSPDCAAAREVGRALTAWMAELRAEFDRTRSAATSMSAAAAASDSLFEGVTVTRPARTLALLLGTRVGSVARDLGPAAADYAAVARARYFPELDDDGWAKVLLAAAVRAYVPMVDPHGEWAPLDEEASVYDVDLEAKPPARLWDKATRTPLGFRLDEGAQAPFRAGDVVLALSEMATAGLPQEQMEQLGYAAAEARATTQAVVLRAGDERPMVMALGEAPPESREEGGGAEDDSSIERIAFGQGDALVVPIKDVRDDLGETLTHALLRERGREGARALVGVVLDLRGNGGGSTDGAYEALGLFLPGAPLFPMKRREGPVDPDRAPAPPAVDLWTGPVATLVDGDTASAAEMIAGALAAYHRGPSVGTATFGKGCAQEYLDDDARAGTLRLTTLLYALPDGSPVQRVGLTPSIHLPFAPLPGAGASRDREAALSHAPPSWRGDDVRDKSLLGRPEDGPWTSAWPSHGGDVGPCKDVDVCRALRALGGASAAAGKRIAKGK